jgi:hypothetical protein
MIETITIWFCCPPPPPVYYICSLWFSNYHTRKIFYGLQLSDIQVELLTDKNKRKKTHGNVLQTQIKKR